MTRPFKNIDTPPPVSPTDVEFVPVPIIEETLDQYQAWLQSRKLRPRAIETYVKDLRRFARALGSESTIGDITEDSISWYLESISHLAGSTMAKALSAIRSYCRWCIKKHLRSDDPSLPIDSPRRYESLPHALSSSELAFLKRLIDNPPMPTYDWQQWYRRRDVRALCLMLYAGLRRSEVAALRWRDVDLGLGIIIVRDGKGGRERLIPIHRRLCQALEAVPHDERKPMFAVAGLRDGKCGGHALFEHMFQRWIRDEGLHVTAHMLRHSFATEMMRGGANIRSIQALMGHKSLETTQIYLSLDAGVLRQAVDAMP